MFVNPFDLLIKIVFKKASQQLSYTYYSCSLRHRYSLNPKSALEKFLIQVLRAQVGIVAQPAQQHLAKHTEMKDFLKLQLNLITFKCFVGPLKLARLGMAILQLFSFLGDSRKRGMAISHSIPRSPQGILRNIYVFRF